MLTYRPFLEGPIPIWIVDGDSRPSNQDPPVHELFTKLMAEEKDFPEYRGVTIDRLTRIMKTGVDVEPTDAPIFVSDFDKAWEYPSSDATKVVFGLRRSMLKPSWSLLSGDATADEIAEVQRDYPYQHENGNHLWFSRIPEQGRNLSYESAYGHWIPGNAKEALVAVFLFGDREEVISSLTNMILDVVQQREG